MPQIRVEYQGEVHDFPGDFTDKDIQYALAHADDDKQSHPPLPPVHIPPELTNQQPKEPPANAAAIPGSGVWNTEGLKGAVKSIGQTLLGGVLGLPALAEAYGGPKEPQIIQSARQALEPANPAQQVGAQAGRMVQYAVPAALTEGASLPVQMAAQASGSGAVAAGGGESPIVPAAIGAAGPVVGKIAENVVPILRKSANENVASAIGPSGAEKKELAKVLPDITARKPFAWTSDGLRQQFEDAASEVATKLDAAIDKVKQTGQMIYMNQAANPIRRMIIALQKEGGAVTPEGKEMVDRLQQVMAEMKDLGRQRAPYVRLTHSSEGPWNIIPKTTVGADVERLRQLKQMYGEIVSGPGNNFLRNMSDVSRAGAAKQGFFAIHNALVNAAPDAGPLGQEYSRLATVRDIMNRDAIRKVAGNPSRLGATAELTAVAGGKPGAAIALEALRGIMNSPAWKLVRANTKTNVANFIQAGDIPAAWNLAAQGVHELMGSGGETSGP